MVTTKQLVANRKNSQRSTGPRSAEGKTIVANNALTHGIFSRQILLSHETEDEFESLKEAFYEQFQPQGLLEVLFWERALASAWRLSRIARIEAMVMDRAIDFLDKDNLSKIFSGCSGEKLMLMSRYEVMLERSLFKALEELKSLQFSRQGNETLIEGGIGFVPQKLGDIITL
ncbi:MAG: hypothetical protein LW832_09910 [Parachlamydia sp.]|jgi:hypothetical protein|nr:hypothetical protein [Parachlamydia sp.]